MTKRRTKLTVLFLLIAGSVGSCWWQYRLTIEERKLLGRWICHDNYSDGSTCVRTWTVASNHTLTYHNRYHFVGTATAPAREFVQEGTISWRFRCGRLLTVPKHPVPKKLHYMVLMTYWRMRNLFRRDSSIVMDPEGSNGRLSHLDHNSFTVHWWNPDAKAESDPVTYVATNTVK